MQNESASTLHPALLTPGMVVGPWRVVDWKNRGSYGAVYQAVPVDNEDAAPVALKLAMRAEDPRFAREVELLSRMHHPSIPRFVGSGVWQRPDGTRFPYFTMEWVEGVSLYDWAQQDVRSVEQVLGVLAQLAGALAELHARGGVHRDVKGDNVLVRRSDGRATLLDFGMGCHEDAAPLTPPGVYPGTAFYRAPESGLFELRFFREASASYVAGPADDVYALGVTACRLVTGKYPKFAEPRRDEQGTWHLDTLRVPPALRHVEPRLRDVILRMLSVRPEERGTAAQIAEALEQAIKPAAPKSPVPLPVEASAATRTPAKSIAPRAMPAARARVRSWLAVAAAVLAVTGGAVWLVSELAMRWPIALRATPKDGARGAGTSGLGDAAAVASKEACFDALSEEMVADDPLPEPLPGQAVPDAKGRCPYKRQVALNGGCWVPEQRDSEECEALSGELYQGTCYIPVFERPHGRPRPRTSSPTRKSVPR